MAPSHHGWRLPCAVLFALAVLTPVVATNGGDDDAGRRGRRDPCRNAYKQFAKGKPLPRQCEPGSSAGTARGDFNGDGFADLAVGVPFEDEDNVGSVGAVNIIYGSADGLTSAGSQYLTEETFGFPFRSGDHFGAALASGDFNDDGCSDLAIGMPGLDGVAGAPPPEDEGAVLLIDGSANGLITADGAQTIQCRDLVPDRPGSGPRTLALIGNRGGKAGAALAWGDFNRDGVGDLAVGIPEFDGGFLGIDDGQVQVFFGTEASLTLSGAQAFGAGSRDRFGAPLAAGDFNGDGASDLVVGQPLQGLFDEGRVILMPGSPSGLVAEESQIVDQNTAGVGDTAEGGDLFGFALAVGDFNGDSRDDLAVGIPDEDLLGNTEADAGAVQVFFGLEGPGPLVDAANDLFFGQGTLAGVAIEAEDRMGRALAAGRFNDDAFVDLAIGVPGEDIGSIRNAGMVTVVYGSASGPALTNIQHWHQNSTGIPDAPEEDDEFGRALSAWNYGRNEVRVVCGVLGCLRFPVLTADLAIGVPFEDLFSANTNSQQENAGAVHVLYGSIGGLTTAGTQFWHQDRAGIGSASSAGDRFGFALY